MFLDPILPLIKSRQSERMIIYKGVTVQSSSSRLFQKSFGYMVTLKKKKKKKIYKGTARPECSR